MAKCVLGAQRHTPDTQLYHSYNCRARQDLFLLFFFLFFFNGAVLPNLAFSRQRTAKSGLTFAVCLPPIQATLLRRLFFFSNAWGNLLSSLLL